jgi:hypothetical protein
LRLVAGTPAGRKSYPSPQPAPYASRLGGVDLDLGRGADKLDDAFEKF